MRRVDVERPPLRAGLLRERLVAPAGPYARLDVVAETGSTNHDLRLAGTAVDRLPDPLPDRTVLVAEHQTAGRGRAGRQWLAPPRSGLFFSVLLRPVGVPASRWGWLSLVTGVALATAVAEVTGVDARLKWPNDLLLGAGQRKGAGILAEVAGGEAGPAVVVGIGLNVALTVAELPVPEATSLRVEGAVDTDRDALLSAVLLELDRVERRWREAGGDVDASGLRERYRRLCATLHREVRVELPSGRPLVGTAVDVDAAGRLVVRPAGRPDGEPDGGPDSEPVAVSAGDVVHVRTVPR